VTAPIETPPVHVVNTERISPRQVHITLSSPITRTVLGEEFATDHVVVSHGRCGDTQIFPANEQGAVLDLLSLWGRDNEHVPHDEAVREWLEGTA
jgi:hypothetical protein